MDMQGEASYEFIYDEEGGGSVRSAWYIKKRPRGRGRKGRVRCKSTTMDATLAGPECGIGKWRSQRPHL